MGTRLSEKSPPLNRAAISITTGPFSPKTISPFITPVFNPIDIALLRFLLLLSL